MNSSKQQPIFIVGCPSSGTTLLYSLLESHSNISCGNETDFLVSLKEIVEGKYWNKLQRYELDREYWYQRIAEFFSSFKLEYAHKQGKQRWADKTPSYTPHIDFIIKLFPNCQIIHIIRDGRDVVVSHRDRWGYKSAIKAVYTWQDYVSRACEIGSSLPSEQYLEVRYEELVKQAELTAKFIFEYLQEPWEPQVLNFNESSSYDKSVNYKKLVESRRNLDRENALIYSSRIGTGKNLDPFLKGFLNFRNGYLLRELGYL